MLRLGSLLLGGLLLSAPALGADPLRAAAEDAAKCRTLEDAEARLACFDAASAPLAEALQAAAGPERGTPERESATAAAAASARRPPSEAEEDVPTWAAAPQYTEEDRAEDSSEFEATIVRITRNNVGRHRFYTDEGAVWEQTQIVEVRPPRSLPAVAEFKRMLTGNPTIKFDVSNRAYRVRRIE